MELPIVSPEQAVLIHLDAMGLPDEVYAEHDLGTLEDRLIEVIEPGGLGAYGGNEFGPGVTTVFLSGPDAERLFSAIEPVLRAYPLCRGARVEVRAGGPDTPTRDVALT
jgi:hypothetical protein